MIKNAFEIFKNDIKAVKNNSVVIFALLVLISIHALYTCLTIQSTWDPYSQTSNIKIAVVNEDSGYDLNGTHYNVGDLLIEELKNNTNFNWQFVNKEEALNGVKNGKYYAALIIPGNFSQDLLSISTPNPHQAQIEYVTNDKLSPITPRMTEAGADAIQVKINSIIIKTIDGLIFGKIKDLGTLAKENKAQFIKTKAFVNTLNGKLNDIDAKIAEANSMMSTVNNIWPKISASLPQIQSYSNDIRQSYDSLYVQIKADPNNALITVQGMESKVQQAIVSLEYQHAVLTSLYDSTGDPKLLPIIKKIENNIYQANKVLTLLKEIEADINNNENPMAKLTQLKTLIDEMDNSINLLAANKGTINQKISEASAGLGLVNSKWPLIRKTIPMAADKLNSINEEDIDKLSTFSNLDLDAVNNYFQSPVEIQKEHIYPIDKYGSALAPFYMAISLWIGGIMAIALLSMRVKSKKNYKSRTVYMGRMGLFLIISASQALLVALGVLLLDIQVSSTLLIILTALFIGLCFMIIVYSLTSAFGNAGKLLSVILLVVQITASGGTFPVELLSPAFQAIHPYLPLTYAIAALREVVAGVLWSNYLYCMGILGLFPILTFILTLLIKGKIDERANWTEEKLKESGLFN
ncbi:MAG: YhgE/Pip domain-containing protein [Methanobacterium sp.]|uniref:YhgE/Pip domain-containing protein n=1 Tax=Methanobacterium sp. TaxID=2164 RepID=UPI003D6564EE|nr:YhgE/Pip domain-containing protein [Methanobacterium sp.]